MKYKSASARRNHTPRGYFLVDARKIALYEIHSHICGARTHSQFCSNITRCAEMVAHFSGLPASFYLCAWFRLFYYYESNRTAILNGGIDK